MNKSGRYGKHQKSKQPPKVYGEWEGEASYFESAEFTSLCVRVVGYIRMAEKQNKEATYRFLREQIEDNRWLYEAVEHCKRAGLIEAKGSEVRTVFVTGGVELKPEKSKGYSKGIAVAAAPSQTSHLPDFYFEGANRL